MASSEQHRSGGGVSAAARRINGPSQSSSSSSSFSPSSSSSTNSLQLSRGSYTWTQTEDTINITLEIPVAFKARDASISIHPTWIKAGLNGLPPILSGTLFQSIVKDESAWTFDTKDSKVSVYEITLHKSTESVWPILITKDAQNAEMDAESEYQLAKSGYVQDFQTIWQHLIKAASKGHIRAQLELAVYYATGKENGGPVERDLAEAAWYYMQAADAGSGQAQYALGRAYQRGEGVTQSFEQAKELYTRSASHDHDCTAMAAFQLGLMYYQGDDSHSPSYIDAERWWKVAASLGDPNAHFNLGILYFHGEEVAQDLARARHHFETARSIDPSLTPPALDIASPGSSQQNTPTSLSALARVANFSGGSTASTPEFPVGRRLVAPGLQTSPASNFQTPSPKRSRKDAKPNSGSKNSNSHSNTHSKISSRNEVNDESKPSLSPSIWEILGFTLAASAVIAAVVYHKRLWIANTVSNWQVDKK